ncbi:MAG TPA: DUF3516 domain-containing protein [Bdellovibrionales bacterium]|nr:DUF3516 domain-containing protein [Bdellovibrionales bacterium]
MKAPLFQKLPQFHEVSNEIILDRFLEYATEKKLELYPAQEEAILSLYDGNNVILNTPTGSGKSLVALALHFHALAMGKRSVYTCPIKALVNEKFLHLSKEFGPDQVGMITGDGSVNPDAPILCCTAEILANQALREGIETAFDDVIMDEFHYYSDRERGVAWQIPLLTMARTRFLLMSATLGEMEFFEKSLNDLTDRPTTIVSGSERPVPLEFSYREVPLHETVKELIEQGRAPIYLVNFTQANAAEQAQNMMSVDFTSKEDKKTILERLYGTKFSSPYGKDIQRFLKHGVGLHHAGLLPKYRMLVEKLAQEGLLKVISGTDTLGVGVNIPIRTVLFTKLCKFDGQKTVILSVRDFHQIAGRAGRKGFDDRGFVVALAPEHVIENKRMEEKAKTDPKKAKKLVKQKPPEKGYVHWDENTFKKLIASPPEALESRFSVSHGMLLNVLSRENEDGCKAMRSLIRSSHETEGAKKKHRGHAFELFRALVDRKIIEVLPQREANGRSVRVNVSLQEDFSLNHSLALWLIDTLALLDPESDTYALDILTLVEAILESPDLILRKQLDRVKGEKLRELKEAGVEYDQRMEELEKLEHPKPLRDFIYSTFNDFVDRHPWVGHENIRPKSIAREMFEHFLSFGEYTREYDLQRAEGILLRYLSEVYRALVQTVPENMRTDQVLEIIDYFALIVRGVDATLLEEWTKLKSPEGASSSALRSDDLSLVEESKARVFGKSERRAAQTAIFGFLRLMTTGQYEEAAAFLVDHDPSSQWTAGSLEQAVKPFAEEGYQGIRTDSKARHAAHMSAKEEGDHWLIEQKLFDNDGAEDLAESLSGWKAEFIVKTQGHLAFAGFSNEHSTK